jgi:methyl-accepting chemotaxis protein
MDRDGNRRRNFRVLDAGLQLKLPFYLLAVTAAAVGLLLSLARFGYAPRLAQLLAELPTETHRQLENLAGDFALTTTVVALIYASVVMSSCIRYTQRFVGPLVPLRRQLLALKNGDYSSRVYLRRNDSLQEIADELNALAETLEQASDSKPDPGGATVHDRPAHADRRNLPIRS